MMIFFQVEPPVKAEVIKAPIPPEHIALQQIFDGLVEKCRGATRNPVSHLKTCKKSCSLRAPSGLLGIH